MLRWGVVLVLGHTDAIYAASRSRGERSGLRNAAASVQVSGASAELNACKLIRGDVNWRVEIDLIFISVHRPMNMVCVFDPADFIFCRPNGASH